MKKSMIMSTVLVLGLFTSATMIGCTSIRQASEAETAISAAKAAKKKAASVGGEWRDVGKFIKSAQKALDEGNAAKALKLANKAQAQAGFGYKQALNQAKVASEFPAYLR